MVVLRRFKRLIPFVHEKTVLQYRHFRYFTHVFGSVGDVRSNWLILTENSRKSVLVMKKCSRLQVNFELKN